MCVCACVCVCVCVCVCDKTFKIGKYLDLKNCTFKEHTVNNLVLTGEDEILNTTKEVSNTQEYHQ